MLGQCRKVLTPQPTHPDASDEAVSPPAKISCLQTIQRILLNVVDNPSEDKVGEALGCRCVGVCLPQLQFRMVRLKSESAAACAMLQVRTVLRIEGGYNEQRAVCAIQCHNLINSKRAHT